MNDVFIKNHRLTLEFVGDRLVLNFWCVGHQECWAQRLWNEKGFDALKGEDAVIFSDLFGIHEKNLGVGLRLDRKGADSHVLAGHLSRRFVGRKVVADGNVGVLEGVSHDGDGSILTIRGEDGQAMMIPLWLDSFVTVVGGSYWDVRCGGDCDHDEGVQI